MTMNFRAAALAATLVLGTSGFALAQGTPPVADPTVGAAAPQPKGSTAQTTPAPTTSTQTTGSVQGNGETQSPPPAQR